MRGVQVVAVTVVLAGLALPASAQADRMYGITAATPPHVVSFDSELPATFVDNQTITGLGGVTVVGADVRPLDGRLYVLTKDGSATGRLWTVDPATGVATLVATLAADPTDATAPYTSLTSPTYGIDFNPVPDRLRVVGSAAQNLRVNPANGATITDGDINGGGAIADVAYSNNDVDPATGTTLFAYDFTNDAFGILNPPNNGTFTPVGAGSGISSSSSNFVALDETRLGAMYAGHRRTGPTRDELYRVDKATGLHALVGVFPEAMIDFAAAVPNRISLLAAATTAGEGTGNAQVTVVRRDASVGSVTASYTTADGTAAAGADYTTTSGTVTFAPGENARTISIPLGGDSDDEPDETFSLSLSVDSSQPGLATDPRTATVTIADDDPAPAAPPAPGRCANAQIGTNADESLIGTAAGDSLSGAGGLDSLFGGAGDDCLDGGAGDDWLSAGTGADQLRGRAGDDVLIGGDGNDKLLGDAGNDRLLGGTGNDRVTAGAGVNVVKAGAGNDTINSKNRKRETVDCGAGKDRVTADRTDRLKGCEKKRR